VSRSISRVVARAIEAGRIGGKRSFAVALGVAMLLLPVSTAQAFFAATGSGQITNVQAGTATTVVSIEQNGALTYAGPSTTNLMPGGTVSFSTLITCTAGCPGQVTAVNFGGWSSDKARCDFTTPPNSFTMPTLNVNQSVWTTGISGGTVTINMGQPRRESECV
jgi:hypothetical protein